MTLPLSSEKLEAAVSTLRERGARITALRRALTGVLLESRAPLNVAELTSALSKLRLTPNKSSIYRELDFLIEQKLVTELDVLEGMKRYEWRDDNHHHHHVVCTKCGTVACVDLCFNEKELGEKVQKKSGFTVTSHILEFFGVCGDCR